MMRKVSLWIIILFLLPTVSAQQIGLSGPVASSPTVVDIDNNPGNGMEIVVGTNNDYMHAIYSNGTQMLKWKIDPARGLMTGISSPALADLDGDGTKEIVIGGQKGSIMSADNPGYVWAYYLNGTQMWRYSTGKASIYSSPVVADIDDNGDYEVLIGSNDYKLYALHGNGELYWSKSLGGSMVSTVAVGDVNEDGSPEIIVASSDGIVHVLKGDGTEITTMQTGGLYISSPALADIDSDGDLEIIIASKDGKVYAWHGDGTDLLGWPVQANPIWTSSPAVGDLDGDGDLEVVVVTDSNDVYAYHGDGALLEGFPLTHQEKLGFSSPALADLDGDGKLEIILGTSYSLFNEETGETTNGGKVYAWHIDGTLVEGFPKNTGNWIKSSPAVADIDGDGKNEIVIGSDDSNLYIWETGATSGNHGWPMFHYNEKNTRMYDAPVRISSSSLNGEGGVGGGVGGGGSASPVTLISSGANEMTSTTYINVLITLSAGGKIDKDRFVETSNTLAGPLLLTKWYPLPTDPTATQFARTVKTVTGDVYALAADASQETRFQYGSLENKLVIARGDLGVDSMAAVAYAKAKNIPILLVKPDELPSVTEDAISKMMNIKQRDIIIIGGPVAVSTTVEDELKKMGDVKRIYGETRIETALALAEETYTDKNKVRAIVITDYANPKIDAVLMSYVLDAPLLYVKSDALSPVVKNYISQHKETIFGATKVVLMGVDPKVALEINEILR